MIRIEPINNKPIYTNNTNTLKRNNIAFTANPAVYTFSHNILKRNGRKYTGSVENYFEDGTMLVMQFAKGILQKAKKLGKNKLSLIKFTQNGEEVIEQPIKRKLLYEKEYKYNTLGELIQVTKDGKPVFTKEYQLDINSPIPITKSINKGEIIEFFDLNNHKLSMAIPDKYVKSDYRYVTDDIFAEMRYSIDKNYYQKLLNDYRNGISIPDNIPMPARLDKIIITNKKNDYARKQITFVNELGKSEKLHVLDSKGRLSFVTDFKYNEEGMLIRKMTEYPNTLEMEIFDDTGLPIVSKVVLKDKPKQVLRLTLRKFDPDTRIQISETTTFNYPKEHIKTINTDTIIDGIQYSEYRIIHTDSKKEYKRVARINNAEDKILEQRYFAPDKSEISEAEFVRANRK